MADKNGRKLVVIKRKKVVAGGHHGGSWKVAYADFVTAMMAFFMVMWILGMDEKTKQAIEGYFSNPVGYKKGFASGASPISSGASPGKITNATMRMIVRNAETKQFNELAAAIRQAVANNPQLSKTGAKIDVVVTKDGLRIELVETGGGETFFPVGSTQMKPAAAIALGLIAPALQELPNQIVLEGHTDAISYTSTRQYTNWELSTERANAARRLLEASGIPVPRIAEVRGYADRQLRVPDKPTDPANRRISLLLPYNTKLDEVTPENPTAAPVAEAGAAGTAAP